MEVAGLLAIVVGWFVAASVHAWWKGARRRIVPRLRAAATVLAVGWFALFAVGEWVTVTEELLVVAAVAALLAASAVFAWSLLALRRRDRRLPAQLPLGTPEPPTVPHDPSVTSGVYFLDLAHRAAPDVVDHVKIGKSGNIDRRIGSHRTISGNPIRERGRVNVGDPEYHRVEDRIKHDLRPWRINAPGVTAVETYEPTAQVHAYIDEFVRRSGQ